MVSEVSSKLEVIQKPINEPYKWAQLVSKSKTSKLSKGIINGEKKQTILEDNDPEHLAKVEEAYQKSCLKRDHLDQIISIKLKNISSIAFGGKDLKTVYLGCLLGQSIAIFESKIAGLSPSHWN